LNNDELTAIVAHVLGHEAYDHDRAFWHDRLFWREAGAVKKTGAVAAATVAIGAGLFCSFYRGGQFGAAGLADVAVRILETRMDYSSNQEAEANCIAAKYLAEIGIPPDRLFDALVKLIPSKSEAAEPRSQENGFSIANDFVNADHAEQSATDFGRMLDTGLISVYLEDR
jgi:predicted Zn-dependent protease